MLSMHQNKIRGWSIQEEGSSDVVPKSWHLYDLLKFLSGYVSLFVNNWELINFRIATSLLHPFLLVSKGLGKQFTGGKKSKQSGRRYVRRGSPEWWAFSRWQQIRSSGICERPTNTFQSNNPFLSQSMYSFCLKTLELSCKEHCRGYP